ncbi:MAG: hypothetical protein IPJ61_18735 [Tessaracoccus sp.]|uniref:hypothetical protein n=1 Tax=Tessaracoccus sp. TaxID=1971211 RepID=UPI001EBF4DEA|nr:hypothetical protein [Tessaracoccus sp.]MBK7823022.1 hypothetical protein [Tessaracoccus sp.]
MLDLDALHAGEPIEGETLATFMADNPDAQTYAATVANRPVFFIQTAGFEFIFAPDSVIKLRLR